MPASDSRWLKLGLAVHRATTCLNKRDQTESLRLRLEAVNREEAVRLANLRRSPRAG
jgi:hypothetical protein